MPSKSKYNLSPPPRPCQWSLSNYPMGNGTFISNMYHNINKAVWTYYSNLSDNISDLKNKNHFYRTI